ncbi:sulfatase [Pontiellaceae bacterium B12227]|nr:sulfatase [Pontiellaceae bacterium B12227]
MKLSKLLILPLVFIGLAVSAKQPNILFLSMDDLKPELGCYGAVHMQTPNIDALASSGMLFEHHYIQQAVCGPSRASMFSGLRPDTTRVWDLQHTCREECPAAFTMQEYFKKAGYATAGSGKIMHGFKNDDPPSWSIPYVSPEDLPYAEGKVPALYQQYQAPAIHDAVKKLEKSGLKKYKEKQQFMAKLDAKPSTECLDLPDNAYSDGAMTDWGLAMLEDFAKSDEPFFLTMGYRKPHLPFVAPKKYWDLYDRSEIDLAEFREAPKGAPGYALHPGHELNGYSDIDIKKLSADAEKQLELIHGYRACVSYVDAQIGKLLAKLKETGLDQNTIVVLWGDHGWHLGDHNIWCKHSNYEQATHSPLIIASPQFPEVGKTGSMVESVDIFPTLCELTGLSIPAQLEGTSLFPILGNPQATVKEFSMSQYPDHWKKDKMGYSMRTGRYRAVFWVDRSVAETGRYDDALIDSVELYDYEADPLETSNLALNPEYKRIKQTLQSQLEHYFSGQ